MNHDEYTVEELLEADAVLNDRADALFDRLARIESTATSPEIEVRVNLEGRLVALTLTPAALATGPAALAGEIFRLTQEASAAALAEGLAALLPIAGEEVTGQLAALIAARPRATPATTPPPDPRPGDDTGDTDDFSRIETWALPR